MLIIKVIDDGEFPSHFERFTAAVHDILPRLGFPPDRAARFAENNSSLFQDTVFEVRCRNGQTAYCRHEGWNIVYIIPSDWANRYSIAEQAIQEITDWYANEPKIHPPLRMEIGEMYPSLEAYFGALLPRAGWDLQPRIEFRAPPDLLEQIILPHLPQEMVEVPYQTFSAIDYADAFLAAHAQYHPPALARTRLEKLGEQSHGFTEALKHDDTAKTWVTVARDGRLAGFCYGGCRWGDQMSIEELAVHPDYWGLGVGRYLLFRCMRELRRNFPEPNRYFETQTYRDWSRALKLYASMGFTPHRAWLEAKYADKLGPARME